MFKHRLISVVFLLVALLAGCTVAMGDWEMVSGSGDVVTREMEFAGFDRIVASHAFNVEIRQGDSFRVVIRIDDNLEQYLQVHKQGRALRIGLQPDISIQGRVTLEAEITMPELTGLDVSGASSVTIAGFESAEAFEAELSGASTLRGSIQSGDARMDISGASYVDLTGSVGDLTLDISGASTADLGGFSVNDADVEASGASKVTVKAGGRLDADASGASKVYYLGNPTMGRVETSGGAIIAPK